MNKLKPCLFWNILLTLGLGLGFLTTDITGCSGQVVPNTAFSVQNCWELSIPALPSLLNPGDFLQLEPALAGGLLLNGEGAWLFANGGRLVFADTVQLRLDGNEPVVSNRLNELYFTLNPSDCFFLDVGKQVLNTGAGFFLNPAGLWPEQTAVGQERAAPPEGKVLLRGEYLFPNLTMAVGWAPQLAWAEDGDAVLWKYFGSPQKTALTWAMVSGGFAGTDLSVLFSYGGQWKTGLNLAKVWGDQLETHCAIGWEERDESQSRQLNKLFCALVEEETGASPPPLKATTAKGSLKALFGGHYTFTGGENLIIEYFYNGSGLTRKEWERVLPYLTTNTVLASEAQNYPVVAARLQRAIAFFAEAGFPGLLRHYGMIRFYKEFRPHLAWEQMAIQNLVDQSGLAIFRLSYEQDRYSLAFEVQIPYGKKESEFGLLTGERQLKFQINAGL